MLQACCGGARLFLYSSDHVFKLEHLGRHWRAAQEKRGAGARAASAAHAGDAAHGARAQHAGGRSAPLFCERMLRIGMQCHVIVHPGRAAAPVSAALPAA